jgi:hypothetical protein
MLLPVAIWTILVYYSFHGTFDLLSLLFDAVRKGDLGLTFSIEILGFPDARDTFCCRGHSIFYRQSSIQAVTALLVCSPLHRQIERVSESAG